MKGNTPLIRGLSLGLRIGLAVAGPLLVLVLAGRFADRALGTAPLLLLLGLVLSLGVSAILVAVLVRDVTGVSKP